MSSPESGSTALGFSRQSGNLAFLISKLVGLVYRVLSGIRRALQRLFAFVQPIAIGLLLAALLFLGAGYLLGWGELVVLGFSGLVALACASFALIGSTHHDVTITMPRDRVSVGQPLQGTIAARNTSGRRLPALRIEIPTGPRLVQLVLPSIKSGRSRIREFDVPTAARGIFELGPARTVKGDPMGLFRREVIWSGTVSLHVHPKIVTVPSTSFGYIRDLEGLASNDLTPADISFHALREYLPGDEPRTIHWKSTARTGRLMVRQFEETRRSHIVVALSCAVEDFVTADEFELAVSVAGSLGVRAIVDARTTTVFAASNQKRTRNSLIKLPVDRPTALLDALSGVDTSVMAPRIALTAEKVAASAQAASLIFLLCGSTPSAAELRRVGRNIPNHADAVVLRCAPTLRTSALTVDRVRVITINQLEQLAAAIGRSGAA